jgi:hypothetical protein
MLAALLPLACAAPVEPEPESDTSNGDGDGDGDDASNDDQMRLPGSPPSTLPMPRDDDDLPPEPADEEDAGSPPPAGDGDGDGDGDVDPDPPPPTFTDIGFSVLYKALSTESTTSSIQAEINIANSGALTLSLSELSMRYYIRNDNPSGMEVMLNWAGVYPGHVDFLGTIQPVLVPMDEPTDDADAYFEFTWGAAAPTVAPGESANFSWRAYAPSNAANNNQLNDYSFDAQKTELAEWDRITLMRGDVVIWGSVL